MLEIFQLWQENKAANAKLETELATLKQDLEKTQKKLVTYNQKVSLLHVIPGMSYKCQNIYRQH